MKKILLTTTALQQPWNVGDWDMTDGSTYAINKRLNDEEDWDALQEVTAELEQAEADNIMLIVRIEELEAKLKTARADALKEAADWVDEMRVSSRQQAIEGILGLINKEAE